MKSSSAFKSHTKDFWLDRAVLVCAYSTIILGLIVLTAWSLGLVEIISLGQVYVPMAEEAALLFIITGIALLIIRRNSQSRVWHNFLICSSGIIGIVALIALIDFGTDNRWNLSNFIGQSDTFKLRILTGKMSPVTAICFLFVSITILLLGTKARKYSVIFSSLVIFTGYTVVVGYSYGVPFLYSGTTIPMAWLTAITFIVSSAGLLLATGKKTAPVSYFMEDSTRARLMQSILPVIFLAMLTHDFIDASTAENVNSTSALTNSIVDIFVLLATGFAISFISRSIGKSIDQNIVERRLAEEALKESEQKLKDIIYCIGDWVWETDENGIYTSSANNGISRYGYQDEEFIGKTPYDFMIPEEAEKIRAMFYEIAAKNLNIKDLENWNIQKDGKTICLLTNGIPFFDQEGNLKGYRGVDKDITQRKLAEAEIRERAVQYSNLANSGPSLIWTSGTDKLCNYFNNKWLSFTGRTLEQEMGDGWTEGVHPDDLGDYQNTYLTAFDQRMPFEMEYRIMHVSGEYKWIRDLCTPNYNSDGEFIGYIGNCFDITERKISEQQLSIAKEKAEESDLLKSAFLSNMSHEIRTPMNGILGFAELLKEPNLTSEQQQDYIRIINKSGLRMLNIINDIIDISKIESGLMKVDISKSNINEQIEYIFSFFKTEVERKGMQLFYKNSLPAKEASIYTDREKLYAIFTNLVKNAIKYTDTGSIEFGYKLIGAETHGGASSVGELVEPVEPLLEFYVKDTGIGIQPDRQKAVFERFIQADISDSRAFQGAGLGLSIAKAYIEMLGGEIRVESESGIGSTFYFTIPYRLKSTENNLLTNDKHAYTEKKMTKKLNILIAEDDEISQELLSISLQPIIHEMQIVTNGVEAVEACRNHPEIDLVLMDIQMPLMDGYEATKEIRKFNTEIIIIAQTAFGLKGDQTLAIEAGCNDYISKPLNSAQLHTVIHKHFQE